LTSFMFFFSTGCPASAANFSFLTGW